MQLSSFNNGDFILFVGELSPIVSTISSDGLSIIANGHSSGSGGYALVVYFAIVTDNTKSISINATYVTQAASYVLS